MRWALIGMLLPLLASTQTLPEGLKIDSTFAVIQGYDSVSLNRLKRLFDESDQEKLVFLHYGGSHIQAENPTSVARKKFQERFGNGGYGLMFNYKAANSYSSINYGTAYTGNWAYNKSYQGRKEGLPLGICGMVVETADSFATLSFTMKHGVEAHHSKFLVLYENDSLSYDVKLTINGTHIPIPIEILPQGKSFYWNDSIHSVEISVLPKKGAKRFRFYGICSESQDPGGVVYHSTGVGAAAFRSTLILDKLSEQAPLVAPDIVLLDFGTNDILYQNRIDPTLITEVEKAITLWRKMFPEVLLVLTSTQDLFYKKHTITAGISFRNLMDSLARSNRCLFWNWYDLSGGINTIRDWTSLGYAKTDHVHLTKEGYRLKGSFLFDSFMNTLNLLSSQSSVQEVTVPLKDYSSTAIPLERSPVNHTPSSAARKYTVKSGDTLSGIAQKHDTTVSKLKSINGLKSDVIRIGQVLRIP